jgi:formylglycine-generating enzyme required for sulfatase activity
MTDTELATLAVRLRTLLDTDGPAAVQAALEAQAAQLTPDQRAHLERLLFGADGAAAPLAAAAPSGTVTVSGGAVHGPVTGVNQGTIIQNSYNRIEQLGNLIGGDQVAGDNIAGDQVAGDKLQIDRLTLVVYTGPPQPHDPAARRALEQAYRSEVAARYAVWRARYAPLPIQATAVTLPGAQRLVEREDLTFAAVRHRFQDAPPGAEPAPATFTDLRQGLARFGDLLLLGPPGGGKTTALWRLALDLAEAGLMQEPDAPLPVVVRLGGLQPHQALDDLLTGELAHAALEDAAGRRYPLAAHRQLAPLLPDLLAAGRLVLLWDGLNEVPRALFARTAQTLNTFRCNHPGPLPGPHTRSIITCRSDDYDLLVEQSAGVAPLPITQATVQGLDPTTIRQLVVQRLGPEPGAALLQALDQPEHRTLAGLARTPLLLTMLCEVYAATGALPTNRGRLLQTFVQQRWAWEQQRHPDTWIAADDQERALSRLAYMLTRSRGRGTSVAWSWAAREVRRGAPQVDPAQLRDLARRADLLEHLGERGMLRFTHQLIQEYFAARALQDKIDRAIRMRRLSHLASWWLLRRYAAPGRRTGWEETLLLLAGIEGEGGQAQRLIRAFLSQPLQAARLLVASDAELDPGLREEVGQALPDVMLNTAIGVQQRIEAGNILGRLGDPRVPVTIAAWQHELAQRTEQFGAPAGYFCAVRPDTYQIGGWKDDEPAADITLPAFWIARFPVTVAQYAPFVAAGYGKDAERWWTPNGWQWKQGRNRAQPWGWDRPEYSGPNQPVIGVTWYEARAFCDWLTEQMQDALPAGYVIRLPTEAEWEVAAAYDAQRQRRLYPWGEEAPDLERAITSESNLGRPAPVGCCPAGAAACGALDMAGNVWEVTTSSYGGYPAQSGAVKKDFTTYKRDVPYRGGSWYADSTYVRCGARDRLDPVDVFGLNVNGFRVLAAPPLAQMS